VVVSTQTEPLSRIARTSADRYAEIIARYFGPNLSGLFADDDVTEIYVNPQESAVRVDTRSRGKITTGERMPAHRVEMLLNAVAASVGENLTPENPRLQAELPKPVFRGSRLQGFVPPVSTGPSFTIRKPPTVIYSLDDYVAGSVISAAHRDDLRRAVAEHRSIVIAGGTNTGKTTLANALLQEITHQFPHERLVLLEDTVELQCAARDHLALRTNGRVTLADLVRNTLRTSPDRIIVGEVRGAEALDLLDAWATGHPGGIATVHASSPEGALLRLDRLAQRANVPPQAALVAEAVGLVVVIEGGNARRRVADIARVDGLGLDGRYQLTHSREAA
jgi:type IV secretion system protein VirB11